MMSAVINPALMLFNQRFFRKQTITKASIVMLKTQHQIPTIPPKGALVSGHPK